ncbi:Response regulator of the LytR/AlgR family protein [Tritonibacter multivorans]|uniref:Response regulator of the LytR/AlgR family protein n=1 Tax=Tritonibacter multivorans TaxID=928856 RepID=A0A0P1G1I3_9RHOB|nr:LytTR family DNA-binding domain-containing protein [Tritonibacter multivorans]MDA7419406.1 LytTR family DNA-binding domain-containing protein [Tritonibacter multivorans]CUH75396.1 Response regulator of the LytR/AlgR family protein [Tritonibacter multivorans]SFC68276.1 transcriptional regulator, LytTR family [Tritonibacter multivorans]
MDFTALHFAIRELHALMRIPTPWICAAGAGLILGLLAPFGTEDTLSLAMRLFYWVFLACLTLFTGSFVNCLMRSFTQRFPPLPHPGGIAVVALVGGAIGAAVLAEVFFMNWLVFGLSPLRRGYTVPIALNTLAISIVVNGLITWVTDQLSQDSGSRAEAAPRPVPALINRLPLDKRGDLISLSVQDHYVEVTTTKGREMVLMRLTDAIREAGGGFQIHRSHWVADGAVTAAQRKSSAAEVTLSDGRALPVSRTYLPVLKEKGLLPR